MGENDIPTKLLWMDLEMTGLDPEQRIIEVAVLITDFEFNELARYEAILNQPEEVLENAEDWPKQNMQEVFKLVRESTMSEEQVIQDLVDLTKQHFGDERAVLAGNSIHQDRRFIRRWWQPLEELLHYRMIDVSSFKIWLQGAKQEEYIKKEAHRAMGDIQESIDELKWSLEKLKT